MPTITFKLVTQAPNKRLDLEEGEQLIPVGLNNGVGNADLPSGYAGTAVLTLGGQQGQTATFEITQKMGAADVVLNNLPNIAITDASGQSVSFIPFNVQ